MRVPLVSFAPWMNPVARRILPYKHFSYCCDKCISTPLKKPYQVRLRYTPAKQSERRSVFFGEWGLVFVAQAEPEILPDCFAGVAHKIPFL